jgi:uncharacterized protein (DUF924 family)
MAKPGWHDDVLRFWFEELTPEDWFVAKPETDALVRDRFGGLLDEMKASPPPEIETDPRAALAAVIVFDQFPRNIHRRQPDAFSSDDLALRIARGAMDRGFDANMTNAERQFLYMPFQHSEVLSDQERSVDLFKSLADDEGLKYALEHREIIARFGRFPHRNRVLGRVTTDAEEQFLQEHQGFGQ